MSKALRAHPVATTLLAFAIAAVAVVAVAATSGFGAFASVWSHLHPGWLVLLAGAELVAVAAYIGCYHSLARYDGGEHLELPLVIRLVVAGFGPLAPRGGFALDARAIHALEGDGRSARSRVLGLGALEWALLAPAAWVAAIVLLIGGHSPVMPSLLWPWAIAVPIGFALGLWLARPQRRRRIEAGDALWRRIATEALNGIGVMEGLARALPRHGRTWLGTALYWASDIAALYSAARFVGLHPSLGEIILAYATGYALTRRSMPLAGAGVTEVLMTLALHWVGEPLAPALAAVVVYRVFNFILPAYPAHRVRPRLEPVLVAGDEKRPARADERAQAAAPLRLSH
jgi:uncharacterized membrane protein YbhN (UPF0104 family)